MSYSSRMTLVRRACASILAAVTLGAVSLGAGHALAAELQVTVRGPGGAPLPNAVVSVYPAAGGYAPQSPAPPFVMSQKNIMFAPYVLVVLTEYAAAGNAAARNKTVAAVSAAAYEFLQAANPVSS